MNKMNQDQRVESEMQRTQMADSLIKSLEEKEQQIIERLRSTQKKEDDAKTMLIEAIIVTSKGKKQRV